ncbi:MAG: site-2 protease family protein [Defluviitaleaceae bacterium]|nr:site-2 protease family protein [Defluviitaleaceae bacterium]
MDFLILSIGVLLAPLPGAFLAPMIHEWVKACTSAVLGDPSPRKAGFLSWNPLKYFEPIGFLFMLAFGVGWGRPVPTSAFYYKDRRLGVILVHIMPIITNLFVGMLVMFLWSTFVDSLFGMVSGNDIPVLFMHVAHSSIHHFAAMNIGLAIFSLIPMYPLAGSKLLPLFVSPNTVMQLNQREKPIQAIVIILLIFGVIPMLLNPIIDFFMRLVWF